MKRVNISERTPLMALLKAKQLYDLDGVSRLTGLCPRWLRRLCHDRKVGHHKLLGRYYMSPAEVAALLTRHTAR